MHKTREALDAQQKAEFEFQLNKKTMEKYRRFVTIISIVVGVALVGGIIFAAFKIFG